MGKNKGLFDKKRFKKMDEDKKIFLKKLTLKKGIEIFESLTSAETLNEFKGCFLPDHPVCLKFTLKKHRNGIASRSI